MPVLGPSSEKSDRGAAESAEERGEGRILDRPAPISAFLRALRGSAVGSMAVPQA